jgi:MYXO-CTERM domain-containing protein
VRLKACWLLASICLTRPAWGAPCNLPDLLESLPPDGAAGVPTNAVPTALYAVSADYLGEPVIVTEEGGGEVSVVVTFDRAEGVLRATPAQPLRAAAAYIVEWPELRGIGTASKGRSATVRFVTGTALDLTPPTFGGVTDSDWQFEREMDDCTDRLEDRFVFDIGLSPAEDDGSAGGLLLRVFQTRGPRTDPAAPEPVLIRSWPADERRVEVVRTQTTALGPVCFSAIVSDLVGQPSSGGERETCLTTVEPPFFEGCAVARPGPARGVPYALLLVIGAGLVARLRQRRR